MKTTCSSREGGVHCNCNDFEGILEQKRYISSVNTWNLSLYLSFILQFRHCLVFVLIFYIWSGILKIHFTLEIHLLILAFCMKCYTLETDLSVFVINHYNFFKNFLHSRFWVLNMTVILRYLHLKSIFFIWNSTFSCLKFKFRILIFFKIK